MRTLRHWILAVLGISCTISAHAGVGSAAGNIELAAAIRDASELVIVDSLKDSILDHTRDTLFIYQISILLEESNPRIGRPCFCASQKVYKFRKDGKDIATLSFHHGTGVDIWTKRGSERWEISEECMKRLISLLDYEFSRPGRRR